MAQALDILFGTDKVLDVAVLARCSGEDGVVDDNAVDGFVGVSIDDLLFDLLLLDCAEVKIEPTREKSASSSSQIYVFGGAKVCGVLCE